ncbi:Mur ligase family protein [Patescibacteria group bacterium]|nr:Mur ligase family protein [Patescibacteria group bacterium]
MFQDLKNIYHFLQALLANIYYGFPSRRLNVIGVTGTDGKTTTTQLIAHVLKSSGKKVSFISTVKAVVAGKEYDVGFHVTTPSPFAIQRFLRQSVENGDEYFVLETTSHAIDQNRVWGIDYKLAVLTNVTHEHLDYHRTYEDYIMTKSVILKAAKVAFVNEDDESYNYIKDQKFNSKKTYKVEKIIKNNFSDKTKFNQYNFSAAYRVCNYLGISDEKIIEAIKTFQLPKGRLELVYDEDFKVMIDFAHTPNAFQQLLPEVKKMFLKNGGRLIHVFGSAGLRDNSKRSLMGLVSSEYSDIIILTEEDFRTEKPEEICRQIASGIKNKKYEIIIDREQAIDKAIKSAKKGDIVLLTGKSHEKSLCRGKIEYPWSEHQAVKKALQTHK